MDAVQDVDTFVAGASVFADRLKVIKAAAPEINWYPHGTLANVVHWSKFTDAGRSLLSPPPAGAAIIDIGAADGDMGFFFESLGCEVELLDTPNPNSNKMSGVRYMREALGSAATIHEQDIDFDFRLERQYDLAIVQGILYHLRNPFGCLLTLAMHAKHMVCNTRVFSVLPDGRNVEDVALCYLWERRESGMGPDNYFAMTPAALRRMVKRAGWRVLDEARVGPVGEADPVVKDERMFLYCERVPNWPDLRAHADF